MEKTWLPDSIRSAVNGKKYEENQIGMSGSKVLVFDDMVLKIQKASMETENEVRVCSWLKGRLPVPEIIEYCVSSETSYCLMSRISGKMACDETYLNAPEKLLEVVTDAIKMLWSLDIADCPCDNTLDVKLEMAKYNVENGLVDMENTEPETFGPHGFDSPRSLLCWLEDNRPKEDIVFSHGDFSLPNIFVDGGKVTGFIDLGKTGAADRWQDLAICYRSIAHNFAGKYNGGKAYKGWRPELLFERLEIEPEPDKLKYYILLDELF